MIECGVHRLDASRVPSACNSARISVVVLDAFQTAKLFTFALPNFMLVTIRLDRSVLRLYPSAPAKLVQFPLVVVSSFTKLAVEAGVGLELRKSEVTASHEASPSHGIRPTPLMEPPQMTTPSAYFLTVSNSSRQKSSGTGCRANALALSW